MADADRLILEAAAGTLRLDADELRRITDHVAGAGWDDWALETVRGRLAGLLWHGTPLRGKDRLPPAVTHYLWHVVKQREWPDGTSLDAYTASIRRLIRDPASGLFTSTYRGAWQLSIVGAAGDLRGPGGSNWVLVDYRIETGHWVTPYQSDHALADETHRAGRERVRWLRRSSSMFG